MFVSAKHNCMRVVLDVVGGLIVDPDFGQTAMHQELDWYNVSSGAAKVGYCLFYFGRFRYSPKA